MKHITVYDIAREANVSVSTISRVLNGTAPVKATTKERIMQIIKKYQFQPNALARSLIKKETGMIGIIMPDISNPFFPEVFLGAEIEAREKGYTFFLCNTSGDYAKESEYLSILQEKRVDGIIFLGGRINLAKCMPDMVREVADLSVKVPIVLVNGDLPNSGLNRVITDEVKGAEMATQHLIDLGHKDIGFIGGMETTSTTTQKVRAFKAKLEENGLVYRPDWVFYGGFSLQDGREQMSKIIAMDQRPTAVFCINDYTAIGAIKAVVEHGLKIPEDFSIVGFDDTPLATSVIPELTTVSQNANELGRTAIQILHKLINKEKARKLTVLAPKLIARKSTGPLGI